MEKDQLSHSESVEVEYVPRERVGNPLFKKNLSFSSDESISCLRWWNNNLVATGRHVRLWNESGLVQEYTKEHIGYITCCTFFDDKLVTASFDRTAKVWNIDGKVERVFLGHVGWVQAICSWPSHRWIVTGSFDKDIRIWNFDDSQCVHVLRGHSGRIKSLTVGTDPNGKETLWSSSIDKFERVIRLWNSLFETMRVIVVPEISGRGVKIFQWESSMVTTDGTGKLYLRDFEGNIQSEIQAHDNSVTDFAIWKGRLVTSSEDGRVRIWTKNLECQTIDFGDEPVRSICIHDSQLWTTTDGRLIERWEGTSFEVKISTNVVKRKSHGILSSCCGLDG